MKSYCANGAAIHPLALFHKRDLSDLSDLVPKFNLGTRFGNQI
jgi:hypothetical protein